MITPGRIICQSLLDVAINGLAHEGGHTLPIHGREHAKGIQLTIVEIDVCSSHRRLTSTWYIHHDGYTMHVYDTLTTTTTTPATANIPLTPATTSSRRRAAESAARAASQAR